MPATQYTRHLIADALAGGTAYQGPATIYLGLATDTPSASVAGTPPDDANYARVAFAQSGWTNDGDGSLSNTAAIAWPAAAADYADDIEAIEAFDAATNGNRLWYELLDAPVGIVQAQQPQFDAGELVVPVV